MSFKSLQLSALVTMFGVNSLLYTHPKSTASSLYQTFDTDFHGHPMPTLKWKQRSRGLYWLCSSHRVPSRTGTFEILAGSQSTGRMQAGIGFGLGRPGSWIQNLDLGIGTPGSWIQNFETIEIWLLGLGRNLAAVAWIVCLHLWKTVAPAAGASCLWLVETCDQREPREKQGKNLNPMQKLDLWQKRGL